MTSLDENNENSYGLVSVVSHVGSSTSAGMRVYSSAVE
jgi:hypothetical protein